MILEDAMLVGIKEEEFWDYTIAQINRIVNVANIKIQMEQKQKANLVYTSAMLQRMAIASCFNKNNHFPQIEEVFPDLFEDDIKEAKIRRSIENFRKFAQAHNQKRGDKDLGRQNIEGSSKT